MIALIGPTSCGKSTLSALLKQQGYRRILEVTTRAKRDTEQNGVDYWFVDQDDFLEQIRDNKLVAVRDFSRYENGVCNTVYYGTSKKDLDKHNLKIVLATNPGAAKLLKEYDKEHSGEYKVFVVYLTIDPEEQAKRLKSRGDELEEIAKRIKTDTIAAQGIEDWVDAIIDNSYAAPGCVVLEILEAYKKFLEA